MMTKVKICGMKYQENIVEVLRLKPDFMGFIFYKNSSRYLSSIPEDIDFGTTNKVGVFVNENLEIVIETYKNNKLDTIQLHGEESVEYCQALKINGIFVIKAFSIDEDFDFNICQPYEKVVNMFLFDAKGKLPGGNGTSYNWSALDNYVGELDFLLSGGINPMDFEKINNFYHDKCMGIDVNSGFESHPGMKITKDLKDFMEKLK